MRKECDYTALISQFLDGELPEDAANRVRSHLKACEDCRRELESFQMIDHVLLGIPEVEPSKGFERSFWQKIAGIEAKKTRWSFSGLPFFGWRPYLATALTALLIAGVFVLGDRPSRGPGPEEILIAEQLEFFMDFDVINNLELLENWEAIMTLKENS